MMRFFCCGDTRQNRLVSGDRAPSASSLICASSVPVSTPVTGTPSFGRVTGHPLIVAGQDFDRDALCAEGFDGAACPQLRRIQEGSKTGEDELLLIADDAVGLFRFDLTLRR